MINIPQETAPLIRGTIYDPMFFSEFVNFHFWKRACDIQTRILNLPEDQKTVAIPLTPDTNPVIVQVALLRRASALLESGFRVVALLRDLEEVPASQFKAFSALIKAFDSRIEIQSTQALYSDCETVHKAKSSLTKTADNSIYFDLMNEWAVLLAAAETLKVHFLIAGQVEALQIEKTVRQMNDANHPALPTLLYLPELWLFYGKNISLSDISKETEVEENITKSLLGSTGLRFRSIRQYLVHVAVLASWVAEDDQPSAILQSNVMEKTFSQSLLTNIQNLSRKIIAIMERVRRQES